MSLKHFPLWRKENPFAKALSIKCSEEKSVYKVTKDLSLTSITDSHNNVLQYCNNGAPHYENGNCSCCWPFSIQLYKRPKKGKNTYFNIQDLLFENLMKPGKMNEEKVCLSLSTIPIILKKDPFCLFNGAKIHLTVCVSTYVCC